jgi:hypothetical protein
LGEKAQKDFHCHPSKRKKAIKSMILSTMKSVTKMKKAIIQQKIELILLAKLTVTPSILVF